MSNDKPTQRGTPYRVTPYGPEYALRLDTYTIMFMFNPCQPCCHCSSEEYAIVICNINAIIDDDFEIVLNGKSLLVYYGGQNKCIGHFLTTKAGIQPNTTETSACCVGGMARGTFDVKLLNIKDKEHDGKNVLEMRNAGRNNHGNYGQVLLLGLSENQDPITKEKTWVLCKSYLTDAYGGNDGASFTFNFTIS